MSAFTLWTARFGASLATVAGAINALMDQWGPAAFLMGLAIILDRIADKVRWLS